MPHLNNKAVIANVNYVFLNDKYDNVNWFTPLHHLQSLKSVKHARLLDTTSSAGDWSGIVFQVLKKTCYVMLFSQENAYPKNGFIMHIDEVYTYFEYNEKTFKSDIENVIKSVVHSV